jgi:hypothetical protein
VPGLRGRGRRPRASPEAGSAESALVRHAVQGRSYPSRASVSIAIRITREAEGAVARAASRSARAIGAARRTAECSTGELVRCGLIYTREFWCALTFLRGSSVALAFLPAGNEIGQIKNCNDLRAISEEDCARFMLHTRCGDFDRSAEGSKLYEKSFHSPTTVSPKWVSLPLPVIP